MANFRNETLLNYPVEEVFKVFRQTAKRDFSNFNEKKAVGTMTEREVGAYSLKTGRMIVKISDYKPNEVYEITSYSGNSTYTSRYEFYPEDRDKTRLVLVESRYAPGAIEAINVILGVLFYRKRVRRRFSYLVKGLEREINENLKKSQNQKLLK